MSLKSFVISSLIIHFVGGLLIYFYYNPIHLSPKLVEEKPQEEEVEEPIEPQKESHNQKKAPPKKKLLKRVIPAGDSKQRKLKENFEEKTSTQKESLAKEKKQELENKKSGKEETQQETLSPETLQKSKDLSEEPLPAKALLKEDSFSQEEDSLEDLSLKEEEPSGKKLEINKEPVAEEEMETGLEIEGQESQELEELEEPDDPAQKIKQLSLRERLKLPNLKDKIGFPKKTEKELKSPKKNQSRESVKKALDFYQLQQKPGNPVLYYPDFARRENMQGRLIIRFFVDENGFVDQMNLEKSSGHSKLDNFILRLLSSYQFESKEVWVRFDQTFKLEGQEKEFSRLRNRALKD